MVQKKVPGYLLLAVGSALLIYKTKIVPVYTFFTWSFIFTIIGIATIVYSFIKFNTHLTLIGGFLTTVSLYIWGQEYITGWPTHWSILFIFIGITTLLMFSINKQPITLIIGLVILLTGFFACPLMKEVPLLSPISPFLETYWPALLMVLGITLVARK